jgi:hypothetical protein
MNIQLNSNWKGKNMDAKTVLNNEIITDPIDIVHKPGYWTRPIILLEKILIIREERTHTKERTEGKALLRNITRDFLAEITEALEHNTNIIIFITGLPGTGKTEAAKAIAITIKGMIKQKLGENSNVFFSFGFKETNEIADKLGMWDIVLQDEQDRLMGQDSTSLMQAILNLQEITFRRNRICYIISSADDATRLKNACHVILEAYAGDWHNRKNMLIAYSARTRKALGFVEIPLLDPDDPTNLEHQKREEEYKKRLLNQQGYISVGIDRKRLKRDLEKLMIQVFGSLILNYTEISQEQKKFLQYYRKEILKTDLFLAEIPGSENYQKRVLNEVWRLIQRWQLHLKLENEEKDNQEKEVQKKDQDLLLELELKELVPKLIEEATKKYSGQKNIKAIQLRTFFKMNGLSKENMDIAIGLTYDYMAEYAQKDPHEDSSYSSNLVHDIEDGTIRFILEKKIEDPGFIDTIIKCMNQKTRSRIKTKKLKDEHIEAWYLRYRHGASLDRLREEFHIKSKSTFSNKYDMGGWLAVVETEILGHAAEDALTKNYFSDYQVIAGNTEPDLISSDKKTMVEVKARTRKERPNAKMLNKKELRHLKKGGNLLFVFIFFQPGQAILQFFRVEYST